MPLFLIATPIGNPEDLSPRALKCLKEADLFVGEEPKVARAFLKSIDLLNTKDLYVLNEHSNEQDIQEIFELCKEKKVALFTDAGTPSFQDPGYQLVKLCRKENIETSPVPGASSLMCLLSMSSERINTFDFIGFLPQQREERIERLKILSKNKRAMVFMDTPYRLVKTLTELSRTFPHRKALLALDCTSEDEIYLEDSLKNLLSQLPREKAEFMLLLYSQNQ